jgi:pyridinium-3,5-bisthiocarboxylic acid mononucleotide nickel chelatase
MKTLYFDCFSGASGDMLVGSLIDLGVKLSAIEWELGKLDLPDKYHLHASHEERQSITGIKFTVHDESLHKCCGASSHGEEHVHEHTHEREHEHLHEEQHHHDEQAHEHHHHDHEEHEHCGHDHGHEHHHSHEDADDGSEFIHEQGAPHEHVHGRSYEQIRQLLSDSGLSDFVKERSLAVFHRIAVVEGKIHGIEPEKVTFHEVGALDSILDIVSFCIGIEKLGKPRILASPLVDGTGWVDCAHGRFPVPAPATLGLLTGIPITQSSEPHELITPTGAALLAEFSESFAPLQNFKIEKTAYGLGTRQLKSRPNVVRALLGETDSAPASTAPATASSDEQDTVVILETNLDDLPGELIGDAQEKLFAAGALDVFYQPIQMKKNRPGVLLSVIATPADAGKLSELILTRTSAFGVRQTTVQRLKLRREIKTVQTSFGPVEVKFGYRGDKLVQAAPEYESARKAAEAKNVPLQKVYDAARHAAGC